MGVSRGLVLFPVLLALLGGPLDTFGQYENIVLPVDTIERLHQSGARSRTTQHIGARPGAEVEVRDDESARQDAAATASRIGFGSMKRTSSRTT